MIESVWSWLQSNVDVLIAIGSAIVALVGAFISRAETQKQRTLQEENLRHAIDAQSLGWGNQCIDILNRASMFAKTRQFQKDDNSFIQQRVNLMLALSSLVERGRLFFPNIDPSSKGAEKEGAYRGSRPPILDVLMYAYYELEGMSRTDGPTAQNSSEFIDQCRRLLVSELQAHVDPRRRDRVFKRYDNLRLDQRKEAQVQAGALKEKLKARRPGLNIDDRREVPNE